jgi:adenylate cyclase
MFAKYKTLYFFTSLLLIAIGLLIPYGKNLPGLRESELFFEDIRVAFLAKSQPHHKDIVVVEITDKTYEQLKRRSPLNRIFLSNLIKDLSDANAKAVGVDLLIDQPTDNRDDNILIDTLKSIKTPIFFADTTGNANGIQNWQKAFQQQFFERIKNDNVALANVEITLDSDAVVRRYKVTHNQNGQAIGLAEKLAGVAGKYSSSDLFKIVYQGKQGAGGSRFNVIKAELIDSSDQALWSFQKKLFENKLVLIGVNVPNIDRFKTPFSTDWVNGERTTAGVIIHANVLAHILDSQSFPFITHLWLIFYAMLVVSIGFLIGYKTTNKYLRYLLLITIFIGIWVVGIVYAIPSEKRVIIPLISPSLAYLCSFLVGSTLLRRKFQEQRDYTANVLTHYVADSVIAELNKHPEKLCLGGERREMSFIFTDIIGFTTFSEKYPAQLVTSILNEYLGGMSDIVHNNKGTIDKYIGDAVVAFWGAPIADEKQAKHAINCALQMECFSRQFSQRYNTQDIQFGLTRIGVHSGMATIGNFGGNSRYDYTAIGDTVNVTARLESANKYIGTSMLVSQEIVNQLPESDFRLVGSMIFKGKSQPLTVYEPVTEETSIYHPLFVTALSLLKVNKQKAIIAFTALQERYPNDKLIDFHLHLLQINQADEPIVLEGK